MKRALAAALSMAMLFAACGRKKRVKATSPPLPGVLGSIEEGVASWYGHPYHGRPSASGEIYDMEQLTAAHRTLPFGTWVRVDNLENERSVEVRINDRGPFFDGRIIDLSHAAARSVGMIGPGTARVRITVIRASEPVSSGRFAVQVGAFRDRDNAEQIRRDMEARFGAARLVLRDGSPPLWRVLVGNEASEQGAGALAEKIRQDGGEKRAAFVVRLDT